MPLTALAHAFARFGTGHGLAPERAKAAARLRAACAAQPWFVAGTGRFCSEIMRLFGARVLVKTGAEGVFCARAARSRASASRSNARTAQARAAEVMMAALIARYLPLSGDEQAALDRYLQPVLRNWNGIAVGGLRPTALLSSRTTEGRPGIQSR